MQPIKRIMTLGRLTHLRLPDGATACGLLGVQHAAHDPHDVDCIRCRRTHAWAEKIGTEVRTKEKA